MNERVARMTRGWTTSHAHWSRGLMLLISNVTRKTLGNAARFDADRKG
jgi:hypothetical protein